MTVRLIVHFSSLEPFTSPFLCPVMALGLLFYHQVPSSYPLCAQTYHRFCSTYLICLSFHSLFLSLIGLASQIQFLWSKCPW